MGRRIAAAGAWLALALPVALAAGRPDILIADFEGDDYGGWAVRGDAFGDRPAQGTLPGQMRVSGFLGRGLVNGYLRGDGPTGVLTSPRFRIERDYVSFPIGGGMYPGEACIDLIVDGEVARTATGPNDRPGGTERLDWHSWDVSDLEGRYARLRIVDARRDGWGHVNIDSITACDGPLPESELDRLQRLKEATVDLRVERRYVHLPVKNGAEKVVFRFVLDGRMVREFDVELAAGGEPDWWAFYDVTEFAGRKITIENEQPVEDLSELVRHSDELIGAEDLYREALRPQFHFTPRRGWNNDPNGMVHYDGEYHLFFQHNPFGIGHGNMHWGHAVSPDMLRWHELPVAVYQKSLADAAFSGGGAVDVANSGGLKTGDDDVIVLAYTSTGRGECIVYSNDRGRTFTELDANPVIEHTGRDPKIVWYEPERKWVMVVYEEAERKQYDFYESTDLKSWHHMSSIEGFFECPEFFELPVDGDDANRKWVLYGAEWLFDTGNRRRSAYMVGTFDGRTFTPETGFIDGHAGANFYAAQTFRNASDGRRIMMGWLSGVNYPGMPFSQGMTVPLELSLRTTPDSVRLFMTPVKELESLHGERREGVDLSLEEANALLADANAELLDVRLELAPQGRATLDVRGVEIAYDPAVQELTCRGMTAKLPATDGAISLQVLVDRGVLEVCGGGGRVMMSFGGALYTGDGALRLGGDARVRRLSVHRMHSAWGLP